MKEYKKAVKAIIPSLLLSKDIPEIYYNLNVIYRNLGFQKEIIEFIWSCIHSEVCDKIMINSRILREDKISIICAYWGKKYSNEYVRRLYNSCRRNTSHNFEFVVFTDDVGRIDFDCKKILIEDKLPYHFNKINIFNNIYLQGKCVYIDIDTVISGSLNEILSYDGDFGILGTDNFHNEDRKGGYNSSLIIWNYGYGINQAQYLIRNINKVSKYIHRFDYWMEMVFPNADILQNIFRDQIVEFSNNCKMVLPKNVRMINFPLYPKPHDCKATWIDDFWR